MIEELLGRMREMERRLARLETLEAAQQYLLAGASEERTIASGVITISPTKSSYNVDTESDDAIDDLDTINGGAERQVIILTSADNGRDPTLKDNTGNFQLAGDFTLATVRDTIVLVYRGSTDKWLEISRSSN